MDYRALYSGGFDFKGLAWGRERDNIGIGYAYLVGGNSDIARSQVFEAYYRFGINEHLALTADLQYQADRYQDADSPQGWISGLRLTFEL